MDLVDEQNIARLQIGQQRSEVTATLDDRARSGAESHPHFAGDNLRERRFAKTGWPGKQHMVEGLAPTPRRLDKDPQIVAQRLLAHELVERQRTQ
jgi:hypothetical protein